MLRKVSRLFVIKTRLEAFLIIYALALGATERGTHYLTQFPGWKVLVILGLCVAAAGFQIFADQRYVEADNER